MPLSSIVGLSLGSPSTRTSSRSPRGKLLRHPVVPFFLFIVAFAPVNGSLVQRINDTHPGGSASPPLVKQLGPGPTPACIKCNIPKGYSQTPGDKGELCTNKRVDCICDGVKSQQPMCLYVVEPGSNPTSPTGSVGPPK